MRIDASRYTAFWANPERYRLREIWRLSPIEPSADSFARLLSFGRRRGTAFHELRDAAYRGVTRDQAIRELKDGGFHDKEINIASAMADHTDSAYPNERYLGHEILFEHQIPGSPHSMVGRIDGILEQDGEQFILDWKTSKYRPKNELSRKGEQYCRGHQVGFYYLGARQLGFDPRRFEYRLVSSSRDSAGVQVTVFSVEKTNRQLAQLERDVHNTCELILHMKASLGITNPWPEQPEIFSSGYEALLGTKCYPEFIPDGFEPKVDHLPLDMSVA